MAHLQYVDELIKEYLVFRGFNSTLKSLDNDLKNDKERGFRVDRITDQMQSHIQTYDLNGLRDLWNHLDKRLFVRLNQSMQQCVHKLKTSILRLYVINTVQTGKSDKLHEFFEKMAGELQFLSEWKDWFVLPYLRNAEDNPTFAIYFTRQWQDTLLVSLQNFLAVIVQNIQLPTVASYMQESTKLTQLQHENEGLKARLTALTTSDGYQGNISEVNVADPPPPSLPMDDFTHIAQQAPPTSTEGEMRASLRSIIFGLPNTSSSRRTSSQAPPEDRRRQRSSSLAPSQPQSYSTSNNSSRTMVADHTPVKRISHGQSATRLSRSPMKNHSKEQFVPAGVDGISSKTSFLVLGQEEYLEHRNVVSHVVFNQSGTRIASADMDGIVNIWSSTPSPKTECSVVLKGALTSVEWLSRTENVLLLTTKTSHLRLYDVQDKRTLWELSEANRPFKEQRIVHAKVLPNESQAVLCVANKSHRHSTSGNLAQQNNAMHFLDIKTQKFEGHIDLGGVVVNHCALNHNNTLLFCGCSDGQVRICDLRSQQVISSWAAHQGEVFTVKLSAQQDSIMTLGSDNKFASWSMVQTGSLVFDQILHERAAGPFYIGAGQGGGASGVGGKVVLLRPYGSLFALHSQGHVFTCSSTGPVVYKLSEEGLVPESSLGGHNCPCITLDFCSGVQCSSCVSAALDAKVTVTTLMHK